MHVFLFFVFLNLKTKRLFLVKIFSHLIFGYLRYSLCYCLILGVGVDENALTKVKKKIKIKKERKGKTVQSLYLFFPQSDVLFNCVL